MLCNDSCKKLFVAKDIHNNLCKKFLANAPEIEIADIADIWAETIGKDGGGACPLPFAEA